MIKRYSTLKIDGRNPYYDDISLIVTSQRGVHVEANIIKKEHQASLLLYIVDDHAVASLRYFKKNGNIYVNLVHTLQKYRGNGYSTALFNHLFVTVLSPVELEVDITNIPAISLYKKLGFTTVETSPEGFALMIRRSHRD